MGTVNLLEAFDYYLVLVFVVGTALRLGNYRAMLGFIFTFSHRWPKLLVLARQQKVVFLRWPTLLPIGLTLALLLANTLASRLVWSEATVTIADLWHRWLALLIVVLSGGVALLLDCRAVFSFGRFDRAALEKDLDRAEYWLRSWHATALRIVTLGLINPRKLVDDQVLEALVKASLVVNGQLWRWSLQMGMRVAFGFALWITWASALSGPD